MVLSGNVILSNQGYINGGDAQRGAQGTKGAGGVGILVQGENNTVNHTVAGTGIEGGESPDATVTIPAGIRVEGNK